MVRIAVIGNGERSARHEAALGMLAGVDVAAVSGPESRETFNDLLTRSDVDAIVVCAPPGPAVDIALTATRTGKRVIMEYPPGANEDEEKRVGQAFQDSDGTLEFLLPGRHHPLSRQMKAAVDAGQLGPLRYAHAASISHWSADDQAARAGWGELAPGTEATAFLIEHAAGALDMVAWLFGDAPVATVFARSCSLAGDDSPSRFVSVVLSFADGSQAIVEVGLTSGLPMQSGLQRLALTGMRGAAYFNERDHDILINGNGMRALEDDAVDGLAAAYDALLRTESPRTDSAESRLAFAAAASLRAGQPVEVGQ
jgi:predicted dehydrogenase